MTQVEVIYQVLYMTSHIYQLPYSLMVTFKVSNRHQIKCSVYC